jgi:hypothetical protein
MFVDQITESHIYEIRSIRGEMRNVYKIFVRKAEVKRVLGRLRDKGNYNIKRDLTNGMWNYGLDFTG